MEKNMIVYITLLLCSSQILGGCAFNKSENVSSDKIGEFSNTYVRTFNGVEYDMLCADYWISHEEDLYTDKSVSHAPDELIMTLEEINKKNSENRILNEAVSLDEYPDNVSRDYIIEMMDMEKKINMEWYIGKKQVSDKDDYIINCDIQGIGDDNAVTYGICREEASLKGFPTEQIISESEEENQIDIFQYTSLSMLQPIIILHESKDGLWYFVAAKDGYGWVLKEHTAICSSKEQWTEISDFFTVGNNAYEKLIITGDKVTFPVWKNADEARMSMEECTASMGTALYLLSSEEAPDIIGERYYYDNYVVKIPMSDENGMLYFGYGLVPVSRDVTVGYLEYTRRNLISQCFKALGNGYGWGGMWNERDCSSYIFAVYACFGLDFAKSSKIQSMMSFDTLILSGKNDEEKLKVLDTLPAGSIIYFPGHVALYLGKVNGDYYSISAAGSIGEYPSEGSADKGMVSDGDCKTVQTLMLNKLSGSYRKNGESWIASIERVVIIH